VSFILDALRKSEHERQRSSLPSLAHVPVAPPPPQMPRWAAFVIALLAAAGLVRAGAWGQSARDPAPPAATAPPAPAAAPPVVERRLPLPVAPNPAPARPPPGAPDLQSLAEAAPSPPSTPLAAATLDARSVPAATLPVGLDAAPLPSAAALAAEGIAVPALRLELHGYAEQPSARFVFINGRKYAEGERLAEGPDLVAVEPRGAVLSFAGRRFLLLPE